ncbi:MAG TPA: leucine--tRNA ligase [Candidatus Polarisedimenticolia bacterium]|nr:leucine--tRNA ligase [Candidatus Polarisedimenticolia bacterium]
MTDFDHSSIETKWQRIWEEQRAFRAPDRPEGPRFYCLEMLPYPSGRIHMGHVRNYAIGDAVARYQLMKGRHLMHPMGWDSFGLPAENAAIQRGLHPREWTESNIADMREQLRRMGFAYDWSREIASHRPEYYRWNQWFFIQMHQRGLAYRSLRRVNWCPQCETVLANEQVESGACWRCKSLVVQKDLEQWFLRTSRYAEELLADLDTMGGWPERVLAMQRNWIGRSEGAFVDFAVEGGGPPLRVFTTRIDTIYGATFLALSPDHPALAELLEGSAARGGVEAFLHAQKQAPVGEKLSAEREKEGVFTGRHAVNPFSLERVPIWVANFIVMDYGTGAIMAVPAHDERDFEFATRYGLAVRTVIAPADGSSPAPPFTSEEGRTVESGPFSGLSCAQARKAMTEHARRLGFGEGSVQFRLKDWGISRQRYWGTPIPMVYCARCGVQPVPESELPVVLPTDVTFAGKGGNPLAGSASFVKARCPACGGEARRETDTMDTFVDSSWYFYRYLDPANDKAPFSPEAAAAWTPIDLYIGGITHAILHLMYARFWSMVMRDLGLGTPGEPVTRLLCQGMVQLGGATMSKSKGNVVAPDEMVERYGADVTRLFILFAAPPERDLEWSEAGIDGLQRFVRRVWRLVDAHASEAAGAGPPRRPAGTAALDLRRKAHRTLARVGDDIGRRLHLNTAIAAIMELVNALYLFAPLDENRSDGPDLSGEDRAVLRESLDILVQCLAPFAPHLAEEAWSRLGHAGLLARHPWPEPDPAMLEREEVTIVVQVNGKVRGKVAVPQGSDQEMVLEAVRRDARLGSVVFPPGAEGPRRAVFVPDKLLNLVVARP